MHTEGKERKKRCGRDVPEASQQQNAFSHLGLVFRRTLDERWEFTFRNKAAIKLFKSEKLRKGQEEKKETVNNSPPYHFLE